MTRISWEKYAEIMAARGETPQVKAPARNKFGACRTTVDGRTYDSRKEARTAQTLLVREREGEIRDLCLEKALLRYEFVVNGVRVGHYTADARYVDCQTGDTIVLDVKGGRATKTEAYRLRKALMRACFGIEILEV
jgi:hypothetical protein